MCIRDRYHVYFREQVQDELREIFEAQYELTLTEEVEIRCRTETNTDPETGETTTEEVPYEYYILNVTLTNKTLPAVILPRLNEQQREIYIVMQQLKGNKPYLWEGIYNGGEDTGPSYEIPGEALDDPAFADVDKRQLLSRLPQSPTGKPDTWGRTISAPSLRWALDVYKRQGPWRGTRPPAQSRRCTCRSRSCTRCRAGPDVRGACWWGC